MARFKKSEAREWARENMHGVANVIIPSYSSDLRRLNEKGIRHDVRKEIENGFWGALLVSEVAISVEEYEQFTRWAYDEAGGRLTLIHHAAFNTLEENIQAVQACERAGAELVLLSYPSNFYATSSNDIYDYTRKFCEATNLGVILFPVPLWGFERVHPAGMEPSLLKRMVADIPNIVAIKAEGGMPTPAGFVQTWKTLSDKVVVTFPIESDGLPYAALVPMQFMGTSNSEYYGAMIPQIFKMIRGNQFEQAMELYWQIHPARMANLNATGAYLGATQFLNRMQWKYQAWLNGYNGGPMRHPTMKVPDRVMKQLREALRASKLEVTELPDKEFFVGRNPI
jgi:4-hydroxy-tetrahydrodipicolinate synthase